MYECVGPTKRFLLPSWRPRRRDVNVLGCCDHRHFYLQTGDLLSAFPLRREQCSPPLPPPSRVFLQSSIRPQNQRAIKDETFRLFI